MDWLPGRSLVWLILHLPCGTDIELSRDIRSTRACTTHCRGTGQTAAGLRALCFFLPLLTWAACGPPPITGQTPSRSTLTPSSIWQCLRSRYRQHTRAQTPRRDPHGLAWAGESILSLENLQRIKPAYLAMLLSLGGVARGQVSKRIVNRRTCACDHPPTYRGGWAGMTREKNTKSALQGPAANPSQSRGSTQAKRSEADSQIVRGRGGRNRAGKTLSGRNDATGARLPPQLFFGLPHHHGGIMPPAPPRGSSMPLTTPRGHTSRACVAGIIGPRGSAW